jgi:hypothetical protein
MIPPRELGRLAILQKEPLRYVERRAESLDLVDDHHYGVAVTQQVLVPFHGDAQDPAERELLIPLGQFSKDRLPNLRVQSPDGANLPLLSRNERATLGAQLFSAEWGRDFFQELPEGEQAAANTLWNAVLKLVGRAVAGSKRDAEIALETLEQTLGSWHQAPEVPESIRLAALALQSNEAAWVALNALTETRLLTARMRGVPGRTYQVTVTYTERFAYRGYATSWSSRNLMRRGLAWLGLITIPIARNVANVGQAASLWIVQSMPEGVEALRYYWKRDRHRKTPDDPVSVEVTRTVASSHPIPGREYQYGLMLDAQIAPSTALVALVGLAALLLLVSTYVYQAIPTITGSDPAIAHANFMGMHISAQVGKPSTDKDRVLLVGLGSIFAAIPAAIAGALAYRGQTFTRRISRGPRALVALLSVLAAVFAVVVSLKGLGDLAEAVAYALSIYSLWLIGIAGYIQWGPRWRKHEKSRWKSTTSEASPIGCRRNQFWSAFGFLLFWTFVVVVFARCQAVLQERHFFTSEFPGNIWRAWWSFF